MEEKVICPICGSIKNKFFCEKNKYKIYNCENCEVGFVYPVSNNLEKIYGENYFSGNEEGRGYVDYDRDKKPMKKIFENYLDKFKKLVKGRKIFDIGTATGYFLDLARKRGWQTSGIEISEFASKIAKKKGHNIFTGQLKEKEINDSFDVITMWDVLEHLDNPKKTLLKVNKLLNKEGLLAINTINKGSLWAKIYGKYWHLIIPPEHLFYYSYKNLEILLSQTGFKVLYVKKIGKKFSLAYIFNMLYSWQKLVIWKKLAIFFNKSFWRKIIIPINLRDNILIIARKKNA